MRVLRDFKIAKQREPTFYGVVLLPHRSLLGRDGGLANSLALQRAVKGRADYADDLLHGLRGSFALVDKLPCMREPVGRELHLGAEFHALLVRLTYRTCKPLIS